MYLLIVRKCYMDFGMKGLVHMDKNNKPNLIVYEYKEISVDTNQASLYMDAYENFGWEVDEKMHSSTVLGKVVINFRRDRKILNKTELTRLQRNFDASMEEIKQLEASKTSTATAAALAVGIIGTAFMAGSVFAVTAITPMIVLCIILAIPGFIGWTAPWFLYKRIVRSRTQKVTHLIEEKYDELYEVCDKGRKLLT